MTAAGPRPHFSLLPWLFASLALHALVLVQWPQAGRPVAAVADTAGTAALNLRLIRQAEPTAAVATHTVQAPAENAGAVRTAVAKSHAATAKRSTAAMPRSAAQASAPRKASAPTLAAATAPAGAATRAAHGNAASASASGAVPRSAAATGWAELVALLHAAIDQHKRYPQSALSMGREGAARVDFRLRPDGHIEDMNIGVSSGVRALDQAAFRAVQAIAPFTHAGRYLDSAQRFQVDVVFRIN